jgi:hypothetical protein
LHEGEVFVAGLFQATGNASCRESGRSGNGHDSKSTGRTSR